MKQNHFYIAYPGNKRKEIQNIIDNTDLQNIDTIIEPYCGTSALSVYLYHFHPRGKEFKYIINDHNKHLIDLYNIAKDENEFNNFIDDVNESVFDDDNNFISKDEYFNLINEDTLKAWFIKNKFYNIRVGMYPMRKSIPFINNKNLMNDFIRNSNLEIINDDGVKIVEQYKNNINALIFLDPPYINLCNDFYQLGGGNIYEYLYNHDKNMFKCLLVSILNENWIVNLLFRNYNILKYSKKYETSKKEVTHLLISNREFTDH
jgi:site-specific DNA-adenine methylase